MGAYLDTPITEKHEEDGAGMGLDFGVSAMQGWRSGMEEAHIAVLGVGGTRAALFGVLDGHGGALIANEAAQRFAAKLTAAEGWGAFAAGERELDDGAVQEMVRRVFLSLDDDLKVLDAVKSGDDRSGTTAVVGLITPTHVLVANCGDSRSVLGRRGGAVHAMSFDHKPDNPDERARIEAAGGCVSGKRVDGELAVSRALGDFQFKMNHAVQNTEQRVSAEPEFVCVERGDGDDFLILACDGIWDVVTNEEGVQWVSAALARGESCVRAASGLIDHCLELNSKDNMSVVVVRLQSSA